MIINDNGTEREATHAEIAYYETWQAEIDAKTKYDAKVVADKTKARQIVLDRLGITADEAALLLG